LQICLTEYADIDTSAIWIIIRRRFVLATNERRAVSMPIPSLTSVTRYSQPLPKTRPKASIFVGRELPSPFRLSEHFVPGVKIERHLLWHGTASFTASRPATDTARSASRSESDDQAAACASVSFGTLRAIVEL
jgi:hypothetical protein